jgi:hypothetical protein
MLNGYSETSGYQFSFLQLPCLQSRHNGLLGPAALRGSQRGHIAIFNVTGVTAEAVT